VRTLCPLWLPFVFLLLACSSPRAHVRIRNTGAQPVREVELSYGKMFGASELKPGEMRERNVKIEAPADLEVRYYDSANQLHTSKGPHIEAGVAGQIEVRIGDSKIEWDVQVSR
jgi:hypothetical protein